MKKFLFLAVALIMSVTSAWAVDELGTVKHYNELTDGMEIALKCCSNTNGGFLYLASDKTTSKAEFDAACTFVLESNGSGKFYLKSKSTGNYIGNNASVATSTASATAFALQQVTSCGDESLTESLTDVTRFADGSNFLNCQKLTDTAKFASGTGAWSFFKVYQVVQASSKTYTVHITGAPSAVKITYKGAEYGNTETFDATGLVLTDITAPNIDGYEVEIDINGTNINVTYSVHVAAFPDAGTYYVKLTNKDSGKRPYIYNALAEDLFTLQSATSGSTNNFIWKVESDGAGNITSIVNGDGRGVGVNGQYKGRVTSLQYKDKGDGYYYLTSSVIKNAQNDHECLNRSNGGYATGNGWTVTTWKGENNADNQWKVETVDVSTLNVYKVVVTGAEGYVTYSSTNEYAYNGGFFLATGTISEADLEVYTIPAYNSSVSVSGNTITVTYTADQSQLELNALIAEAEAAYADNDEPLAFGDNLITATSQFDSNATETREGSIGNLLDGNLDTYWHSNWSVNVNAHVHYLQVSLTEPISGAIKMTMGRRSGAANDHPVEMTVEYSADNSTYTLLPGSMKFSATTGYVYGTFTLPANAKYLRFFNEDSNGTNDRGYWHCSEFQLNKVTKSNNIDNPAAAATFLAAIATAKAITSGATQSDVQTLRNAIDAYKSTVDPVITSITWNLYDGTNLVDSETLDNCKKDRQYTTTLTVPYGYLIEGDKTVTATEENQTITLTRKLDPKFPFEYADSKDNIEHWYALNLHCNNKHYAYYSATATPNVQANVTTYEKAPEYAWGFVGNPTDGFVIYNRASGTALYSANNSTSCTVEEEGSTFKATLTGWSSAQADGGFCLKVDGQNYVNFNDNLLNHWDSNDAGSTFHAIEIDFSLDAAYKEAKAAALQALTGAANIDLYAATDIATANSAIDGITYDPSNETSINDAIATLDGIMDTFYATADGKKFALVSKNDWSTRGVTRYLTAADNTTDRLTAAENVELFSVFTATYDATQNAYKVATAYKPAIYLPVTGNASSEIYASETPGYYTFVGGASAGKPAMISCISSTVSNSQGGIHLNSGKNIVVWGPDGAASQWAFELVSDTDYETLKEAYETYVDWDGLEEIITTANSYPVGHGLSQYSWIEDGEDYTEFWPAIIETAEDLLETRAGEAADVQEMIDYVTSYISELQLNMPKAGTFLRLKGFVNTSNYLLNTTSGGKYGMGTDNVKSIFYYDGEHLLSYENGIYFGATADSWDWTPVGSEGSNISFTDCAGKGAYLVSIPTNAKYTNTWLHSGAAGATNADRGGTNGKATDTKYFWTLEEVTELPVTITSAGYATLYAPVNLTIPTGVKAYGMTVANEKYLSPEEIDTTIPANMGVVLEAAADTYNFAITETAGSATSDLTGTCATIASAETDGNYVFSIKDGTPGFYKFVGSELKGFKAYYQTSVASINGFSIDFGGQTVGVNSVISATNLKAGYDIQGRRINKIQKGINILNGKKIIK